MIFRFDKTPSENSGGCVSLYDGIELSYVDVAAETSSHRHEAMGHIMQINYCHAGQVVWNTGHGKSVFLNPGDFSMHTLDVCTDSTFVFPDGQYHGLMISVDLQKVSVRPPELFAETNVLNGLLYDKFCKGNRIAFFAGNERSESIFSEFYGQSKELALPYQRIKTLELFLYLAQIEMTEKNYLAEYPPEQVEIVRKIHNMFLQNMERRITIEELSRQYLINPTTLKAAFKAVYGTSLAAHMKKHRMEQAAKLLRETSMSVAEVAAAVGYESQSKFATAFKNQFYVLPNAYRKHLCK